MLTQADLRARAVPRLGPDARGMLFTRDGLEQATRPVVAALHAQRMAAAGARTVADLGCGLGLDARAFADAGLGVVAVERDAVVAAAAEVNLTDRPGARVVHGDAVPWAREHVPAQADAVWLDPARRQVGGGGSARVFDPEAFSPPLSVVEELAATGVPVGVKLGPGLPHEAVPAGAEAEWVSVDGDVVEAALWFNAAARPGVRRAARVIDTRGGQATTAELVSGADFGDSPGVEAVGEEGMPGLVGRCSTSRTAPSSGPGSSRTWRSPGRRRPASWTRTWPIWWPPSTRPTRWPGRTGSTRSTISTSSLCAGGRRRRGSAAWT